MEVYDNDSVRYICSVRRIDRVRLVDLHQLLRLQPISSIILRNRLRWFGHAVRRPEGELVHDVIAPEPPATWRMRRGGQLKTWATTVKEDLALLSGPAVVGLKQWKKQWFAISAELRK